MLMCAWPQSNVAALHIVFLLDKSSSAKLVGHDLQCMRLPASRVTARSAQMNEIMESEKEQGRCVLLMSSGSFSVK